MHEKRIMHRDLKPANIFISQNGELKVGDLGLGSFIYTSQVLTRTLIKYRENIITGRIFSCKTVETYSKMGAPLYMSPELLCGERYDMKIDVWSIGCIAFELSFNFGLCDFQSPFRQKNGKKSLMELFNKITKFTFLIRGQFKAVSIKYSDDMRNLIRRKMVVNP